jgi:hypothetical protein
MSGLKIYEKKITVSFFKIHFIRFEMHMERPDKSENIFGKPIKWILNREKNNFFAHFFNPLIK